MMFRTSASESQHPGSRKDGPMHFERNARIFASDGPVGALRQIVVDEATGEISMLVIAPEDGSPAILVPAGLLHRSAGSALFLSVSRAQFARAAARAARFDMAGYQRANLKRAARAAGVANPSALPLLLSAGKDAATAAPASADAPRLPGYAPASPAIGIEIPMPAPETPAASSRRPLIPFRLPRRRGAGSSAAVAAAGD